MREGDEERSQRKRGRLEREDGDYESCGNVSLKKIKKLPLTRRRKSHAINAFKKFMIAKASSKTHAQTRC